MTAKEKCISCLYRKGKYDEREDWDSDVHALE